MKTIDVISGTTEAIINATEAIAGETDVIVNTTDSIANATDVIAKLTIASDVFEMAIIGLELASNEAPGRSKILEIKYGVAQRASGVAAMK